MSALQTFENLSIMYTKRPIEVRWRGSEGSGYLEAVRANWGLTGNFAEVVLKPTGVWQVVWYGFGSTAVGVPVGNYEDVADAKTYVEYLASESVVSL